MVLTDDMNRHVAMFPEVMFLDVTANTNRQKRDFFLMVVNRIQDKSVHAQAFALERQQSPVSYVGIDTFSHTILKIMYRTVSNSTFDDESQSNTTRFRSGTESNLPAAQDKQVLYSPAQAIIQ